MKCQRRLFSLPDNEHYLNCAYMSPLSKPVELAGLEELKRKRNPTNYGLTDFFEPLNELKQKFGELINAENKDRVAIIPSASYGLANAAKNIKAKQSGHILLVEGQFPSNFYIWKSRAEESGMDVQIVARSKGVNWSESIIKAINDKTAAVIMPHVHWADGHLFDLKAIGLRSENHSAFFIVDGTQSVGALTINVKECHIDALVCAGYKWLMGAYGLGLAYYGAAFDGGTSIEENWLPKMKSDEFAELTEYQDAYRPMAWRYNVGESSNFIYVKMLLSSLNQIMSWGVDNIQQYCRDLTNDFIEKLKNNGFDIAEDTYRSSHLFGVLAPLNFDEVKMGQLLLEKKVFISKRGDFYRISPHVYNTKSDFDMLFDCFNESLN